MHLKLEVALPTKTKTQGAILVYQLKSIDLIERKATFIEKVPAHIVKEVTAIAELLVQ